ncbi:MAG TPA: prepilin-type N-terminal cleavage/methylation domain-containing protein [Actinomycetota bacterium]|nr:prepilin-type N-terminal cleavage/methylation domain-containing protein [Actinomycetota bacterium]
MKKEESGFTFVEMLVMMTVFSALATGVYGVMLTVSNGSEKARTVAGISEQARLGFNRMVRDTREGKRIDYVSPDLTTFEVHVDFDGNGVITPLPAANAFGDLEELTYSFDAAAKTLRLNGEVLLKGVECVRDTSGNCLPPFSFGSNRLEFDTNTNGVTSWQELDAAPATYGVGNGDGQLNWELPLISNVSFALRVKDGNVKSDYYGEAQLRNQR